MERALFYLRLFPGTEAEYDRRHAGDLAGARGRDPASPACAT